MWVDMSPYADFCTVENLKARKAVSANASPQAIDFGQAG
jgi:hypothetical protein